VAPIRADFNINLKRYFADIISVAEAPAGVHPKMANVLENIFGPLREVGGDIGKQKRRRTSQRTWKDSNSNTMFLD
jgi:hypothetical protein